MADILISNGSIWSLDPALPHPEALLIRNGMIIEAGSEAMVKAAAHPGYAWYDLQGRTVVPGLCDAHIHLLWTALVAQHIDLDGVATLEAALDRIQVHAATLPEGAWVLGHGWDHSLWGGRWPTAADLDAVTGGRPAWLTRKDLHSAWCNSATLNQAGIEHETSDSAGGRIGRAADGQWGLLFEDAQKQVRAIIPVPTMQAKAQAIQDLTQKFLAQGITSVHVPEGPDCLAAVQNLYSRGELGVRVLHHLPMETLDSAIDLGLHSGFGDRWVRLGGLKLFSDGSLGSQTAWMHDPYEASVQTQPNYGMALFEPQALNELVTRAMTHNISLTVHAIGDAANTMVLDAMSAGMQALDQAVQHYAAPATPFPHKPYIPNRIEHAQVLAMQDFRRFAELGVIASVQPIHATADMDIADQLWGQRCESAYAWRSLLNAGVTLAFGSDAPVESWNPWWGIHSAVTRQRRTADSRCWQQNQCLTLEEALWGYTVGPALASGESTRKGSLTPGKLADLVIIEQDLHELESHDLHAIDVIATMVEGIWAWQNI